MQPWQMEVGIIFTVFPIIVTPFYARIVYIFLTKKNYRDKQCYRIMSQIGLLQCLLLPGFVAFGIAHVVDSDFYGIPSLLVKNNVVIIIMLRLSYPTAVHTFCLVIAYLCAVAYYAVLFTPWCGLLVIPGVYATCFDYAKPYSHLLLQIITFNIMIVSGGTLIIYLVIIGHLVQMHLKVANGTRPTFHTHLFNSNNQLSISKQEKSILSYALVRFITDEFLTVSFSLVTSATTPLTMFVLSISYYVNILLTHNFAPDLQYVRVYVKTTFGGQKLKNVSATFFPIRPALHFSKKLLAGLLKVINSAVSLLVEYNNRLVLSIEKTSPSERVIETGICEKECVQSASILVLIDHRPPPKVTKNLFQPARSKRLTSRPDQYSGYRSGFRSNCRRYRLLHELCCADRF
ncbi:hypothetical protein L596_026641 [Steinernema carpocapsae]|uniref:G protein-coupled receptor n=1 Tax=Steinernema carpocapsae TaxID=34508 RepID=A0A4U5M208_STECR|nr:hypothetical protein L596_026641 [Steinernema carpocapsae]